jgi:periplasmic divalent cation tolerance protein
LPQDIKKPKYLAMQNVRYILVYIPCPDAEEAKKIGQELLRLKLAACVNILPGMQSLYWWEEKITQDNEVLLLVKTRLSFFEELEKVVTGLHSYTTPCIVGIPFIVGNSSYWNWIESTLNS